MSRRQVISCCGCLFLVEVLFFPVFISAETITLDGSDPGGSIASDMPGILSSAEQFINSLASDRTSSNLQRQPDAFSNQISRETPGALDIPQFLANAVNPLFGQSDMQRQPASPVPEKPLPIESTTSPVPDPLLPKGVSDVPPEARTMFQAEDATIQAPTIGQPKNVSSRQISRKTAPPPTSHVTAQQYPNNSIGSPTISRAQPQQLALSPGGHYHSRWGPRHHPSRENLENLPSSRRISFGSHLRAGKERLPPAKPSDLALAPSDQTTAMPALGAPSHHHSDHPLGADSSIEDSEMHLPEAPSPGHGLHRAHHATHAPFTPTHNAVDFPNLRTQSSPSEMIDNIESSSGRRLAEILIQDSKSGHIETFPPKAFPADVPAESPVPRRMANDMYPTQVEQQQQRHLGDMLTQKSVLTSFATRSGQETPLSTRALGGINNENSVAVTLTGTQGLENSKLEINSQAVEMSAPTVTEEQDKPWWVGKRITPIAKSPGDIKYPFQPPIGNITSLADLEDLTNEQLFDVFTNGQPDIPGGQEEYRGTPQPT